MSPMEMLFLVLAGSCFLALFVYGVLTPWYLSWTGRGLFMMLGSISALTILYAVRILTDWEATRAVTFVAYILMIIAINFGITGNIIFQQFIQPAMQKRKERRKSNGNKYRARP